MAGLLTINDALTYAPAWASLDGAQVSSLVNLINYIVESPDGANRKLDIQQYIEIKRLTLKLQNTYLAYRPLVFKPGVDTSTQISFTGADLYNANFQIRIADAVNYYNRAVPVQPWLALPELGSQVQIEHNGQLSLFLTQAYFYNFPEFSQTIRTIATEIRCSYYAGYDFSQSTPEITNLKIAACEIGKYCQSKLYSGVSSIQGPFDDLNVSFNSSGAQPYRVPSYLLLPFTRLRLKMVY
jgi:hypothetical protein